jgi:hypothetical protein
MVEPLIDMLLAGLARRRRYFIRNSSCFVLRSVRKSFLGYAAMTCTKKLKNEYPLKRD